MTLSQFAVACGATPKWVQNAASKLGWSVQYTAAAARHAGLVKQLQDDVGVPLEDADRLAADALSRPVSERATDGPRRTARVVVDVPRYLSDFTVRLARAMSHHEPRRRGRPVPTGVGAIAAARRYGWDIGLLEWSLRRTAAERVRRLDQNLEFVESLRARR
jgi:hypothetical protein